MNRISIALATYNSGPYLHEQISSLLTQTRQPDEIVVVDDCSTDGTGQYINNFLTNKSIDIRILKNDKNLGHQKSFDLAIQSCTGDIIFLCDQDDVWHRDKIKDVEQCFKKNPQTLVIINDAEICDGFLNKTGYSIIEQTKNSGTYGKNGKSFIIGCATAFRSSLRALINPIPIIPYGHDKWIHEIGNLLTCRMVFEKKLQLYRRHGNNSSTWAFDISRRATWSDMIIPSAKLDIRLTYVNQLEILAALYQRLLKISHQDYAQIGLSVSKTVALRRTARAINSLASRLDLVSSPKLSIKFKATSMLFAGKYSYFLGLKSFAKDLLLRNETK